VAAYLGGCATAGRRTPPLPVAAGTAPWELPAAALGTQRLFRVSYDGPDGDGSFRLTLRLAAPGRYQVVAVDPFGRSLWTLDAAAGQGLWIDHRARAACRLSGSFDVVASRLTPFPLAALPALLLGRLPEPPAAGEGADAFDAPPSEDGRLEYRDDAGRRWTATLGPAGPRSWSFAEPDGEVPSVFWSRAEPSGEAYLSDRLRGVQLRWRETVAEPLAALEPLAVPPAFAEVPCDELYPPLRSATTSGSGRRPATG